MVFMYRISSGEVMGVSTDPATYAGINTTYYGTRVDPPTPNGADLSVPKIWDGGSVRNATANEIAGFPNFAASDLNLQQRDMAWDKYQGSDGVTRKYLRAAVSVLLDEINLIRTSPCPGPC